MNSSVPVRVKHNCIISAITALGYNQPKKLTQIQNTASIELSYSEFPCRLKVNTKLAVPVTYGR